MLLSIHFSAQYLLNMMSVIVFQHPSRQPLTKHLYIYVCGDFHADLADLCVARASLHRPRLTKKSPTSRLRACCINLLVTFTLKSCFHSLISSV